ncbi:hypothetical protein [Rhodococcoides fascians]|uniref:hypothetical protein n=1 Tax=Rhodococcoides fascians TaxID=1828 RepID=UPI000A87E22F|nr:MULTISPECIES: hypothetical protein [Rhodococcus]
MIAPIICAFVLSAAFTSLIQRRERSLVARLARFNWRGPLLLVAVTAVIILSFNGSYD